eukprot:gb/GECG01004955.1/.p1 GENE.gb/GECG01004955.1/~~gb/GECG01004955.1/.p1  ORF type:complete len:374 (+),score=44.37 gb/GECG01004955.1/:1-1122(+)
MTKLDTAKKLMEDFAARTGLQGSGNRRRRYLWTDAFAVQTFLGLSHITGEERYRHMALTLIDEVHNVLGRFREDDSRKGWISGLSEDEGRDHPTIGGLRIGKPKSERAESEPFHEDDEWDRDGQYFHYITRWIHALLHTGKETSDPKYLVWAAELTIAGGRFIGKRGERPHMYWKMSTDLSRPSVPFMGAHDPLEGGILARQAKQSVPDKAAELDDVIVKMDALCAQMDWKTSDPLGLGGLLLSIPRAMELEEQNDGLPSSLLPSKLYKDCKKGLKIYKNNESLVKPATRRLAFRECGLSLGLRVTGSLPSSSSVDLSQLNEYMPMAETIESFWSKEDNQSVGSWQEHLDINAVSLAASLTAATSRAGVKGFF